MNKRILNLTFLLQLVLIQAVQSQTIKIQEPVRFLALGDSYTIGASVNVEDRWPNQFVDELLNLSFDVEELKIIAQTGWRTDVLMDAINQQLPLEGYNLVSLLIGVNNQYQGGSVDDYIVGFEELLKLAIQLAGNNPKHVFVVSIPDYAYTPFGNGNPYISAAIDEFNAANSFITEIYNVKYINITPISRNGLQQPELVANDGLHPSGLQYQLWVQEIMKHVEKEVGIHDFSPKEDVFSIEMQGDQLLINSPSKPTAYQIIDLAGTVVLSGNLQEILPIVNISSLSKGLYLAKVKAANNRWQVAKFSVFHEK